jgi:hypothetical protein
MESKNKKNKKARKAIAPFYYERLEWAMRCRQDLTAHERIILVIMAMLCDNEKPTETWISRGYIAQMAGAGVKLTTVGRAINVLVAKNLIRRRVYAREGVYEKVRTIMNWALISRDQFKLEEPPQNGRAEDDALEPFEPLPLAAAGDAERDAPGFDDTDLDLTEVEEALGTSPGVAGKSNPKTTPKTNTTPKTTPKNGQPLEFDDSNFYVDEPPKPAKATLSATAIKVLQKLMPLVRQRGSAHAHLEQADGAPWFNSDFVDHCKAEGMEAVPVTLKVGDDAHTIVECVRIAAPFPEYVAKRLSEHTGQRITPRETATFSRFEKGPDAYSVLEYALCTESWCSLLKKADAPAGLLFKHFEAIRQGWLDEGGFFFGPLKPEDAQQSTQDAAANQQTPAA